MGLGMKNKNSCCFCEKLGYKKEGCKYWIDYEEDDNCCLISIDKHDRMTLKQISERLGISLVRVAQLEKQALKKLQKKIKI